MSPRAPVLETPHPPLRADGALYAGRVRHARVNPLRHRFSYRVFTGLFDIDRLDALAGRLRLFSHNRFNLFSFHDRDHGPRDGSALRPWVEARLAEAGLPEAPARIALLTLPRILGYAFNPISVYYCHDTDGRLIALLYQVHNTFGEAHCYTVPLPAPVSTAEDTVERHAVAKAFHVSPFLPMTARYHFTLAPPGERLHLSIRETVAGGNTLLATIEGRRRPLTDASLLRLLITHPLLTLKVVAGIHVEAVRLWMKGAKVHPHPGRPEPAPPAFPRKEGRLG
ncbi:MAG: DUF1365 domain-containing protein [Alphaproteobacteria bacterium]|nr:DUF1365 domain-containing protein [Alphaproteobacteria bacterium]